VQHRTAEVADRGHARRRLTFSTPLTASLVVVVVMAVVAGAILLGPRALFGPGSSSPSPAPATPTPTTEPTPTLQPTAAPTVVPTPIPTLAPNSTPTPVPTAAPLTEWTGLVWSDPVTPSFTVSLYDLVRWGDGYVAVGEVFLGDAKAEAAFLSSPDGVNWTVQYQTDPGSGRYPEHLETFGGELFAFSRGDMDHPVGGMVIAAPPLVWRSSDGATWTLVDSPSWRATWDDAWFLGVESGPDGIVAIGNHLAGEYNQIQADPVVLRSIDGFEWNRMAIDGLSPQSVVTDIVGFRGGFALLGGTETSVVTGVGMPQAWFSDDGVTWTPSPVAGATATDNQFDYQAHVGTGGMVSRSQLQCAGCVEGPATWVSADGRSWQRDVDVGVETPSGLMASDGTRIVILGTPRGPMVFPPPSGPPPGLTLAYTSTDGRTWTELSMSHPMTDGPERFWVVPDGVIYAGEQSFWFGTAVGR
jgi:hypothetical protein